MDLLGIFQEAIKKEVAARELYERYAEESGDEAAQKLFLRLAGEEQRHREILLDQYEKIAGPTIAKEWGD